MRNCKNMLPLIYQDFFHCHNTYLKKETDSFRKVVWCCVIPMAKIVINISDRKDVKALTKINMI